MRILKFLYSKASLKRKVLEIEDLIKKHVKQHFSDSFWINSYGAYDIDPKHLVFWICVKSDNDKMYLKSNKTLNQELRNILAECDYPKEAIPFVHIDFESQETVDKESNGNWYQHFK